MHSHVTNMKFEKEILHRKYFCTKIPRQQTCLVVADALTLPVELLGSCFITNDLVVLVVELIDVDA